MTKKLDREDFLTFEEIFYDPNNFKKIKRRRSYARKRGGKREGEELEESKLKGIFGDPNRQIVQFQSEINQKKCVNRWSVITLMISICMKITLFS